MVAIDCNEIIVDVNKKSSEILGYLPQEMIGKNWFDNLVPEASEKARQFFRRMIAGTIDHIHSEFPIITSTGEELTFDFHNLLVRDTEGSVLGVLSSAENVTRGNKDKEIQGKWRIACRSRLITCLRASRLLIMIGAMSMLMKLWLRRVEKRKKN